MKLAVILTALMLVFLPAISFGQCAPSGECLDYIIVDDIVFSGGGQIVCHQITYLYFLSNGTAVQFTETTCS